jgi:hypothetical protein
MVRFVTRYSSLRDPDLGGKYSGPVLWRSGAEEGVDQLEIGARII